MVASGSSPTTNWAAHRIREEIPGFEENANPAGDELFYLTGEHIFPWQFDEDPALIPFKEKAEELAQHTWENSPYDSARLLADAPTSAAAIYLDDIFVPFDYSMGTANCYRDLRPHVTNAFQHDGIRHDGAAIFARLRELVDDH